MVMSIVLTLVVFSIIVVIHELGHFVVAKRCGVWVQEFALGMGPAIISRQIGETLYSLRAFPLGGYCRMYDGEDGETEEGLSDKDMEGRGFNDKSLIARAAIMFAGPFMNFVLAFLIILAIESAYTIFFPKVMGVVDGYGAQEAGIQVGDVITAIDGKNIGIYEDIEFIMQYNKGEPVNVEILRDGESYEFTVQPKPVDGGGRYILGFNPQVKTGLFAQTIEGVERAGIIETADKSIRSMVFYIREMVTGLIRVFTFNASPDEVSGPIGVTQVVGDSYEQGLEYGVKGVVTNMAYIAMLLSANLGAVNLLPIPALDGGRLLFLLIEAIRRRPMDKAKEGYIHFLGFVFVMVLMVMIAFNDITKII